MRILIVEDEVSSRHILNSYLSPYGECESAEDGAAAVAAVEKSLDAEDPFALITLDIKLPNMNGMEVLNRIRELEAEKDIPLGDGAKIIMMTALDDHKKVMEAFRQQCEVYLVKPIDKQKLISHLKEMGLIS